MNIKRSIQLMQRLARDETGSVNSAELVMIITLLAIGLLVGMKAFRDSAVTEFADMGQALANLNQTYSLGAITVTLPSRREMMIPTPKKEPSCRALILWKERGSRK